jgi:two-component system, OmpR family, sensor histidine kinase MtrB
VINFEVSGKPQRQPRPDRAARPRWSTPRPQLVSLIAAARQTWRRSLQVRMVTITLLASSLLVGIFGFLVVALTTDNSLDRAYAAAQGQVREAAAHARDQLSSHVQPRDTRIPRTMEEVVRGFNSDGGRLVALVPPPNVAAEPAVTSGIPVMDAITDELREEVAGGQQAKQIFTARLDPDGGEVTYLVYGAPVQPGWGEGRPYELYHLTPLTAEIESATDIRNTVLATGAALVLLLAVVTGLITRLVVRPVRLASRTAQRLSAGLLDQRMVVKGEDDLALLAASFNQMAANLQHQIVRLEDMSRQQRRFTSDVSHELRTPLTTVRMAADLLFSERAAYPPEVARSAELLQHELDRFENLLTELLEISRFDAGFATLDSELVDLGPVVRRAVERFVPLCERIGTEIRLQLPSAPVIAEVDPRRVTRILRNLIGNAVDHGEGRPVEVALAGDGTTAAITVRDHGVGLNPGEEKLVFNRFWRADPSRARQTGGTGLGLSISMEDAKLHGGWLEAWGDNGRGCQFRLTLPLRSGDRVGASPLPLIPADAYDEADAPLEVAAIIEPVAPTVATTEPVAPKAAATGTTSDPALDRPDGEAARPFTDQRVVP